jgi:hypothetical protein
MVIPPSSLLVSVPPTLPPSPSVCPFPSSSSLLLCPSLPPSVPPCPSLPPCFLSLPPVCEEYRTILQLFPVVVRVCPWTRCLEHIGREVANPGGEGSLWLHSSLVHSILYPDEVALVARDVPSYIQQVPRGVHLWETQRPMSHRSIDACTRRRAFTHACTRTQRARTPKDTHIHARRHIHRHTLPENMHACLAQPTAPVPGPRQSIAQQIAAAGYNSECCPTDSTMMSHPEAAC